MKKKKIITSSNVGIIFSVVGIIASILVVIINALKHESIGVGIGLVIFCLLSLFTNTKNNKKM